MGLGISMVKLNLDLWRQGYFKDFKNVIEMGAQELHLKLTDFDELVRIAGVPNYKKEDFSILDHWPGTPRCSARKLYQLLGIKDYSCIDMNKDYGSIPMDLNYPLEDRSLFGKYDLVTDHGTNEHAFCVSEAYRTMHRLCKPNGLLICTQMVYQGNGYYMFDASFYEGLAAANNYKILYSSYIVGNLKQTSSGSDDQYLLPLSRELLEMLDWGKTKSIGICYVMQKQSDKDFCIPYQYDYLSVIQRNHGYQLHYSQNPPSRSYVPIHGYMAYVSTKDILKEGLRRIIRKIKKTLGWKQ